MTVEEACMSQELTRRIVRLDVKKQSIQDPSTAKLRLHFMKMMDILRMFLKGERVGILALHIKAMYDMMPYLAASGTGTRNAILAEPATTAVHDNVGIDVPIIYRYICIYIL